jgi:phosphatidylserine decarboxylase
VGDFAGDRTCLPVRAGVRGTLVAREARSTLNAIDFRRKAHHVPIAREGIPYVGAAAFVTLILAILGHTLLTWIAMPLTLLVAHFFRDPERVAAGGPMDLLAPADGKIIAVERVESACFFRRPCLKIGIFLSVFDVHVNRVPCSGTVREVHYQKGRFLMANVPKASLENEQSWVWIQTESGQDVVVSQVAGIIARRIVCWPTAGEQVERGERFGMIRFGSRTDLYVSETSEILVSKGDRVYGGETLLCRLR